MHDGSNDSRAVSGLQPDAAEDSGQRLCDADGCRLAGEFKAPKARDRLRDYYWFCLEHVRAYNAAWNFYADMDETTVEKERRGDTYWHRPTWKFGTRGGFRGDVNDPFGLFEDDMDPAPGDQDQIAAGAPELAALGVMGLEPPVTREKIKTRYKELVKQHHPDANGGDKDAEERLKAINQAYATLTRAATPA